MSSNETGCTVYCEDESTGRKEDYSISSLETPRLVLTSKSPNNYPLRHQRSTAFYVASHVFRIAQSIRRSNFIHTV